MHINRLNIGIIEAYPSTIFSLATLLEKNNLSIESVKHIICTAEKLTFEQKERIENFFKCKVFDYYGSTEQSAFIKLTKEGLYLNDNEIAFIEVLDKHNKLCKEGEIGNIIVIYSSGCYPNTINNYIRT